MHIYAGFKQDKGSLSALRLLFAATLAVTLQACGGGGGDAPAPPAPPTSSSAAVSGSLVWNDNGNIYVMNLATKAQRSFAALDFSVDNAVSASLDGVIAQLADRGRDQAIIRLTQLDGSLVHEFVYNEDTSFSVSGAIISPDSKAVAFAFNTYIPGAIGVNGIRDRGDRTVVCETRVTPNPSCVFFNFIRDPAWTPDNKLIGLENGNQFYINNQVTNFANPASNQLLKVGPGNLDRAQGSSMSPDGKTIVFSRNTGVDKVYGLDVASGVVTPLTADGIGQYHPAVSPDGAYLAYRAQCCQTAPNSAGAVSTGSRLHAIPFKPGITTSTPYAVNFLTDAQGKSINVGRSYGITPKTL
jgi:WD40-like Beta Propeller Repeat